MAEVLLTADAQVQYLALTKPVRERINAVFARLARWPDVSGAKPLRGGLAGHYRVRTGDYRVQFTLPAGHGRRIVLVGRVGHRDGFYE